jgi:hypothetical protein
MRGRSRREVAAATRLRLVISTKMVDLRRHLPDRVAFAHQSQLKRLGAAHLFGDLRHLGIA